ncbi:MAG TPA: methylenetetrahydrofolate reductase C-terminal domain-containing protein [Bacteroidota bacterium]|nr:methylenetetrahydrofolate reductase C-terminal domain-containing protein [Bacteroidota bacterium]
MRVQAANGARRITGSAITPRERRLSRVLLLFEDIVKVPLFGCQRCGECLLSSTAFICSQNCPKRMRNGPCGGTGRDGSCEVYPDRKCVWYRIYRRSERLHRISLLYRLNGIHNWNLEGTSAWLNVFKRRARGPILMVRNDTQRVEELVADGTAGKD